MQLKLDVPTVQEFAERIMGAEVLFERTRKPLRELVETDRVEARRRRDGDERGILVRFLAALLERNTTGSNYLVRIAVFERRCDALLSGDKGALANILRESHYRFPNNGAETLLMATRYLAVPGFSWLKYFAQAEAEWETGFEKDPLFDITGIGWKVRNFALSEFLDHYCAPDLHVLRIMARTGLVLHGYGDPDFSTAEPAFVRKVINGLARETGFPGNAGCLPPAVIDRMLWYYGQDTGRCSARPGCQLCPARGVCLTGERQSTIG